MPLAFKLLCEVERKQDLCELALPVGTYAAVFAREHNVGEIERLLSERRNVDYASGRTCFQERQEQVGEQEAGKIVHCEAQFVAVGAGLPCPLRATAANPGVVDEEIEALRRALHRVGQAPHFGKSGNVGLQKFGGTPARVDCCNDLLAASAIAAMH